MTAPGMNSEESPVEGLARAMRAFYVELYRESDDAYYIGTLEPPSAENAARAALDYLIELAEKRGAQSSGKSLQGFAEKTHREMQARDAADFLRSLKDAKP